MEECFRILKEEKRGVLSVLGDDDYPYGTPMNHWYDEANGKIYFHCGKTGHRLDALKRNSKVSFCVFDNGFRKDGEWAWNVKSVIIFGKIEIIDDMEQIAEISTKLSLKFTQNMKYIQNEIKAYGHKTLLLQLSPEHICGKLVKES